MKIPKVIPVVSLRYVLQMKKKKTTIFFHVIIRFTMLRISEYENGSTTDAGMMVKIVHLKIVSSES